MGQSYGSATYGIVKALESQSSMLVSKSDLNSLVNVLQSETSNRTISDSDIVTSINNERTARIQADTDEIDARNSAIATALSNVSETKANILSKLGISTLTGSNTGDETASSIIIKLGYTPQQQNTLGIITPLAIGSIITLDGFNANVAGGASKLFSAGDLFTNTSLMIEYFPATGVLGINSVGVTGTGNKYYVVSKKSEIIGTWKLLQSNLALASAGTPIALIAQRIA